MKHASRLSVVAASLVGSVAIYGAQVLVVACSDPTPTASADTCTATPKTFTKLAEGSMNSKAGTSDPIEVRGYGEIVVAVENGKATQVDTFQAEFALEADGFFGATGEGVNSGIATTYSTNPPGGRLRVDGNFVRIAAAANSGRTAVHYEVWGVK